MSKELIEFDVFDAGLNTKADPINLLPGQSPSMNNVVFGDYGSIKTRGGVSTHNSVAMANRHVQGLFSYQPSTMSAQMLAICGGNLYVLTGAATTPVLVTAASGEWGVLSHFEIEQMNEKAFISSPDYDTRKFNGNEFTKAGVYPPTQVLTAACDAAGSMTGTYQYVYWGVNSYSAEGDYIVTPSAAKTIASGYVRVNNIPTAPAIDGIDYWKIGRNTAGADGVFWYLTDVTNGVTSFTDTVADENLDTLAPTDQGYPRRFRSMCVYGARLWGCVDDILWYSNVNQPEEFPSTNFIRVGQGEGQVISAIVPFMGMIVISMSGWRTGIGVRFSEKTYLYVLRIGDSIAFNDPENWYLNLIGGDIGSESHRACIPVGDQIWLVSRNGVSVFNGSSISVAVQDTSSGGVVSQKISDPITSFFDEMDNKADIWIAAAIKWKDRVYLSIPGTRSYGGVVSIDGVAATNVRTLVYDYMRVGKSDPTRGAWSNIEGPSATKFIVHEGELYGGGPYATNNAPDATGQNNSAFAGGYIFKWDNGKNYDTVAGAVNTLNPSYTMAPIRGNKNHTYNDKDFRILNIWASGAGTLTVTFGINGDSFSAATTFPTVNLTLASAGSTHKINLPNGVTGKHLWIKFDAAPTSPAVVVDMNINRVQVFYNLRGLRNA